MDNIPYKKFAISLLLLGKDVRTIVEKVRSFRFSVEDQWIIDVFKDMKSILPPAIVELLDCKTPIGDDHADWLKHFGAYELCDSILKKDKSDYKKWIDDCMWIINNRESMSIVNILLFNDEPLDSISDIIQFKFRKKIGVDAMKLYNSLFWDCENMTAREALFFYEPFRKNAIIIREFATGQTEVEGTMLDQEHNGMSQPVTFHNVDYIKWKLGYRKIKALPPTDFMERVKLDSQNKYYEIMHSTHHAHTSREDGSSDIGPGGGGCVDITHTITENLEESKAKLAKAWVQMYMRAEEKFPTNTGEKEESFFDRLDQYTLDFEDTSEQIVSIDDNPGIMGDIKGDM